MQVYEPMFLILACVSALSSFVMFAAGRRHLHRPTTQEQGRGLPLILLAFAEVPVAVAMARRALEPHHPTVQTLMLLAFGMGLLAAAAIVVIAQWQLSRRQSRYIIPASSQA